MLLADLNYKKDYRSAFAVDKGLAMLYFFEVGSASALCFDYLPVAEILHLLAK